MDFVYEFSRVLLGVVTVHLSPLPSFFRLDFIDFRVVLMISIIAGVTGRNMLVSGAIHDL